MPPTKSKEKGFDPGKLQQMVEPLTVRVEKIRGNTRSPITLPGKEGNAPGTQLKREDILQLEDFLLNEWSGGGFYSSTVTDSNNESMTWDFGWDPRTYPEKIPPNNTMATATPQVQVAAAPLGGGAQAGGWLPASYAQPQPQPQQAPVIQLQQPQVQPQMQQQPQPQPIQMQQPAWGGQVPMTYNFRRGFDRDPFDRFGGEDRDRDRDRDRERERERERERLLFREKEDTDRTKREADDRAREQALMQAQAREHAEREKKALEEKLREYERQQIEAKYKAELDRQQQEARIQTESLREEMRRIADAAKKDPESEELKKIRDELNQAKNNQLQDSFNQRFNSLQESIARMVESQSAKKPASEDDTARLLREELARQQETMKRMLEQQKADFERERERSDRARAEEKERFERQRAEEKARQEAIAQEQRFKEEMRGMSDKFERTLTQLNTNKSDPLLEFIKENTRVQAEIARENSRAQEAQVNRLSSFMMQPAQLAGLIKDSSSSSDQFMNKVITNFGGMFETYRKVMESVANVTQGGGQSPTVGLIQEGLGRASELAQQWMQVQNAKTIGEAKVKQAQAAAAADIAKAQQASQAQQAAQQRANANGLNGAIGPIGPSQVPNAQNAQYPGFQPPPKVVTSPPAKPVVQAQPVAQVAQVQPTAQAIAVGDDIDVNDPTVRKELELFGMAYKSVTDLRQEAVRRSPEEIMDFLLQGIAFAQTENLEIPAFKLFLDGRFPVLIDLLLPAAPQAYKDACVQILFRKVEGEVSQASGAASGDEEGDDDEGDDEDDSAPNESNGAEQSVTA